GERGRGLGEDDRIGRRLLLVAGLIDAAARELLRVVVVVLAHADDVLGQRTDRRGELDAGERDRRSVLERIGPLADEPDDVAQIANGSPAGPQRQELIVLARTENLPLGAVHGCNTHGSRPPWLCFLGGAAVRQINSTRPTS